MTYDQEVPVFFRNALLRCFLETSDFPSGQALHQDNAECL